MQATNMQEGRKGIKDKQRRDDQNVPGAEEEVSPARTMVVLEWLGALFRQKAPVDNTWHRDEYESELGWG